MRKAWLAVILIFLVLSFLAGRHFRGKPKGVNSARRILYYVDPMHPAYRSDKPGIAPDCGMQLEPVYSDGPGARSGDAAEAGSLPPGTVNVSTEKQQLIGVRVATVASSYGPHTLRVPGRVVADEEHTYRVVAGADGFIENALHNPSGTLVKKNQRLATYNSPDIVAAELMFLQGVSMAPGNRNVSASESDWRSQTTRIAGSRLRSLGMSEAQVRRIVGTHQIADSIDLVSPADGWVLARNISPGQRFEKGVELYRIGDLSRVWILADVFEPEAKYFRPGAVAKIRLPGEAKTLGARVSRSLPEFDPATRTMKVRLEVANPGLRLRPEMFVDVDLPVKTSATLSIPVDALLDSGLTKRVFIDRGNGYFEPREVETGMRFGGQVQVLKGLKAGERIVTSGVFLIDSESRLKNSAAPPPTMSGHSEYAGSAYAGSF